MDLYFQVQFYFRMKSAIYKCVPIIFTKCYRIVLDKAYSLMYDMHTVPLRFWECTFMRSYVTTLKVHYSLEIQGRIVKHRGFGKVLKDLSYYYGL